MADENVGVNPPDFTTLAGKVRLLTGDTDPEPMTDDTDEDHGQYAWYSDAELEALGALFSGNAKKVAIHVLSIVAVNQAMLLKKWTTDDLAVDGPAIVKGIEATLKRLAADAADDDAIAGTDEFFGIFEPTHPYLPGIRWATFEYIQNVED